MTPEFINQRLNELRESLAKVDALPQLSLIAILIGVVVGFIIVLFRIALSSPPLFWGISSAESFEELSPAMRATLLSISTVVIAGALGLLQKNDRQMSVSHVIDRLHNHQGRMPGRNYLAQFFLGIVAIVCGHSVGREGPTVHLGAGAASKLGSWLRLPNNSMQILIACGVAAGIAASFDTPLAGVIFAMEVIVMEYSIVGFVPVILASVIGAAICKGILGQAVVFEVGHADMNTLIELLFIVVIGLAIGLLAGVYVRIHLLTLALAKFSIVFKLALAGVLTIAVAAWVPEVMGLGYDTIRGAFTAEIALSALLVAGLAKLALTPIVVALGIPGGLIGPSLFVGACLGAVFGGLIDKLFPGLEINASLYILLGMVGMMGAVINAPLAALIAVLELSHNPQVIFPAMLMIVVACMTTRQVFQVRGLFMEQLRRSGRDIELGPASRALSRIGVMSAMNRKFLICDQGISHADALYVLSTQPDWLVFSQNEQLTALWAADLAHFLEHPQEEHTEIDLGEVPGRRYMMHGVPQTASLYDALKTLKKSQCTVLYVTGSQHSHRSVFGILTLDAIQNHYQPKEFDRALV